MKIATYNVNGVNGRLPRLLEWLAETHPDVACLQEIKTDDCEGAGARHRVGGVWRDLARTARPPRRGDPGERRNAAGDSSRPARRSRRSRKLATWKRKSGACVVASVYLPNGNPQPGPRFDYKLAWFERLIDHAQALLASGAPVVLAGDFNVVPTDEDIYNAWLWRDDAVMQPESRDAYRRLLARAGSTRRVICIRANGSTRTG